MNKNELINKVALETNLTKTQVGHIIEATLETAKKAIKKGDEVRLSGFGTFFRRKRETRKGRNPQTGRTITIKSRWVPRFRAGKLFKEYVK